MANRDKKVAEKQIGTLKAYKNVFNSPEGRVVLQDLMKVHHMKGSSFDPNPTVAAFKEGERNVILRILTRINIDINELQTRLEDRDV